MPKAKVDTVVVSSLNQVFPDSSLNNATHELFVLNGEPVSFQIAYRLKTDENYINIYPKIDTDLPLSLYSVGNVPVLHIDSHGKQNGCKVGLFPDMLLPKEVNPPLTKVCNPWQEQLFEKGENITLKAYNDCWQALWLTVCENGENVVGGNYEVKVQLFDSSTESIVGENSIKIHISNIKLPKQELLCTNWFHYDCLCDYYNVKLFSNDYFEILKDFVTTAVKNGMNMLLLPAFTPPLDTSIGKERMTVQLVKITKEKEHFSFDFSLMKYFIDICRECGIEYFEHSHLFTQWGATSAPKIIGTEGDEKKQFFGWETDVTQSEYKNFLKEYLSSLLLFIKTEGLDKKIMFHISDEPFIDHAESYENAVKTVRPILNGYMMGDALSNYIFYEKGLTQTPIVDIQSIDEFLGKCDHLWCYYTGGEQEDGLSNRLITTKPEHNRLLGIEMYRHNIEGFLHWGYNYYYDTLSQGLFDPKTNPCGYKGLAGVSFLVYPGADKKAIQSIRQKVFYEGINDMRALVLLEKLCGRNEAEKLIFEYFGDLKFTSKLNSSEQLLNFRQAFFHKIQKKNKLL